MVEEDRDCVWLRCLLEKNFKYSAGKVILTDCKNQWRLRIFSGFKSNQLESILIWKKIPTNLQHLDLVTKKGAIGRKESNKRVLKNNFNLYHFMPSLLYKKK